MNIVFFGSPTFAVPFLNTLLTHGEISVVGVVTQPDRPTGRSGKPRPSPIAEAAEAYRVPVLKPGSLSEKSIEETLRTLSADVYVVIAYGNIIPRRLLEIPPLGVINIHPSLLPKYRGATPMQAAILAGDDVTGITIMKMDAKMDHGPILGQLEIPLDKSVDYPALETFVAYKGPQLLVDSLLAYARGTLHPKPQDESKATYVKLFDRDTGRLDWKKKTVELERMIRAYRPWPGTWSVWNGKRLKILSGDVAPGRLLARVGKVIARGSEIAVICKSGALQLKEVQLEGGKPVSIQEFVRGHADFIGSVLE